MFSRPSLIFPKFPYLPPNLPAAFLGLEICVENDRRNNINAVVWSFSKSFGLFPCPKFRVQNSVHRWTPLKADWPGAVMTVVGRNRIHLGCLT